MITIRDPESIYKAYGQVENGTFAGRWHFSFDQYFDPKFERFGCLRVCNDDTLSPGAVWPLHPHKYIEVVTYIAAGEFRHEDEHGLGGILKKGWVQHTTVGTGMWHSEINNRKDEPMRFIQLWFLPDRPDHAPAVEQKQVEKKDRTDRFLPLVSNADAGALRIKSDAAVYSLFLTGGKHISRKLDPKRGYYLYILEGATVGINGTDAPVLSAAMITAESKLELKAAKDTEILFLDVGLLK